MSAPPFLFVTGNAGKLAEARRIVGAALAALEVDLPEIQSLDGGEVLAAKADAALARAPRRPGGRLETPIVVEETSLEVAAWNGFPGPLVKWMLAAVGAEGIARAAAACGDARAVARCALLWTDGERRVTGEGETRGTLVAPPRGERGFGWDPVFQPDGETRTYGELPDAAKDAIGHRGRAWRDLLARLAESPSG